MVIEQPLAIIVEDDPSWQQILAEILTDSGLGVEIASSLDEAAASLRSHSHRLAVVDMSLDCNDHENRDGLKVLDAVRRIDPGCRAILLTGYATVELAVSALTEFGAFTFLRKEMFQRSQFREVVRRALSSAPAQAETASPNLVLQPAAAQPSHLNARRTALVVDDDAGWRNILAELLRDLGYGVLACAGFGEALGYLRRGRYDLFVTDLSLTGEWDSQAHIEEMDGYKLLQAARSIHIPVLIVSGLATQADIQKAYQELGVFAYVEKSIFDRATFRQIVTDASKQFSRDRELDILTEREREVLNYLAQGLTNKEIAEKCVITTNTVKRHLKAIFEKLQVHTRSAAAAKAIENS
jgi:DNA-binding NarL/FixJ family response regulator